MRVYCLLFLLFALPVHAQKPVPPTMLPNPTGVLQTYRENLKLLRQAHPNRDDLPDLAFFLFGMGDRLKLIYRNGRLLNALTGNIEEQWTVKQEIIVPSEYVVQLTLADGQLVQIREDETGVWLLQSGKRPRLVPGTRSRLSLPRFATKKFGPILRVLHQEVLINTINGRPMANFMVYQKPRFHDAALMAMVLRETSNLTLIRDWVMAIRDPFDRVNKSIPEPDNLGQVLFLISLVSDKTHPALAMVLDSVKQFQKDQYISGKTDNDEHPVFQTKWFKYGLKALELADPYAIPKLVDSYSSLFWPDYTQEHVVGKAISDKDVDVHPYLGWAEDHFYEQARSGSKRDPDKRGLVGSLDYPLSWEQQGIHAHYPGLTVLDKEFVKKKTALPHARHAAEMFLLLIGKER